MDCFAPEQCHGPLLEAARRELARREGQDFASWRKAAEAKLRELVGWMPERVPLAVRMEGEHDHPEFRERRLTFSAEANAQVPCHLLLPHGKGPFPVIICLQGHSTGMHISLGRPRYEGDEKSIAGGRDFALQAVRRGYAALALEQRGFGERKDGRGPDKRCSHATMTALLLGRTMIGERVWDVSRAIDVLEGIPEVDAGRVGCMGNSGGGTVTYYAACLEPRITAAMPSCAVCTYGDSIGSIDHCQDNYLPGVLQWLDMGDLGGLVAPRPLVVVAGREDGIFPLAGVQEAFRAISRGYAAAGAADRCRLVIGEAGHQFYPEQGWPVFAELTGW